MNLLKKKSPLLSPQAARIAGVSLVAFVAVGAIVIIAHQATPSATAAPVAKPVVAASSTAAVAPAPGRSKTVKGKAANGATSASVSEIVTISGCLEQKDDAFRLKDTSGADAPKSRSAKTLFLKKHSSTVTLVDAGKRLKLGSHVGERVSITGTLVDREMQGRTLQRVAESCD